MNIIEEHYYEMEDYYYEKDLCSFCTGLISGINLPLQEIFKKAY